MSIGAIIGAVPAGKLADKVGRKKAIIATALPFLTSWVMIVFASHVVVLYVARIFGGMGIGLTCVVVPMYIGELAHPSIRGILGSIFQLAVSAGVLYGFVIGSYVSYLWFAISCGAIEVLFLCTFFLMPESPQWLMVSIATSYSIIRIFADVFLFAFEEPGQKIRGHEGLARIQRTGIRCSRGIDEHAEERRGCSVQANID